MINAAGESQASAVIEATSLIGLPLNVAVQAVSGAARLTWDVATERDLYKIMRRVDGGAQVLLQTVTNNVYNDIAVSAGQRLSYADFVVLRANPINQRK
ncbi:MAG: hypothetical protein MZW92_17855 [Comamonadaceae bacterium]|nr:hypothetical protein [Comamonadaceae bacterium]